MSLMEYTFAALERGEMLRDRVIQKNKEVNANQTTRAPVVEQSRGGPVGFHELGKI